MPSPAAPPAPRILIAGLPRSGTTWTARVLGATGAAYVHEPDNHLSLPEAWSAKQGLGSFPALVPGQAARSYEHLWELAFAGGGRPSLRYSSARLMHRAIPRSGRGSFAGPARAEGTRRLVGALADQRVPVHPLATDPATTPPTGPAVVVKSVFCARSVEWLADRFGPSVLIVERHPFAVIASWRNLGWDTFLDRDDEAATQCEAALGVARPPADSPWLDRAAWHFGFLSATLREAAARHPEWIVVRHEALCADPLGGFRRLSGRLGLDWSEDAERFLLASNRRGRGYSTNRVWAEEVDGWHTRLDPDDQEHVVAVLDRFDAMPARSHPGIPAF